MMDWDNTAKVGAVAVSLVVAVLAHRRGRRTDTIAERSGAAANGRAGVEQAFKLLDDIIDQLRADRLADRARFAEDLDECRARFRAYVRDHP